MLIGYLHNLDVSKDNIKIDDIKTTFCSAKARKFLLAADHSSALYRLCSFEFLGAFAKLLKVTVSFVTCVNKCLLRIVFVSV